MFTSIARSIFAIIASPFIAFGAAMLELFGFLKFVVTTPDFLVPAIVLGIFLGWESIVFAVVVVSVAVVISTFFNKLVPAYNAVA